MIRLLLFLLFLPKISFSNELNLICTNNYIDVRSLDVKDVFLIIDTDKKKIDIGGLSFFADTLKNTDLRPSSLISKRPTFHPFCAKDIAVALPIPDAAPVIKIDFVIS